MNEEDEEEENSDGDYLAAVAGAHDGNSTTEAN